MKNFSANLLILMMLIIGAVMDTPAQTRIRFGRGSTSATVSGSLAGHGTRTYVLGARAGQRLSANVSSRGGCVQFNGSTSISMTTEDGNNYLDISNECKGRTVRYSLTVTID